MMQASEMTLSPLRPWMLPRPPHRRHPIFAGVEGMLHTAFPLVADEPEERLAKALSALLAALPAR